MRAAGAVFVWASVVCTLALPARGQEQATGRGGCTTLVAAAQPPSPQLSKGEFSAVKTLNVSFSATLLPTLGFETPEIGVLTVTTPNGHVYQEIEVPIGRQGEAGKREKARRMPGHPFPVPVVEAATDQRRGAEPGVLVLSLPPLLVGGTSIQHGGLYGRWIAEFRPGDGSRSCNVKFVITQ